MQVEVDTAQIAALEQQVENVYAVLAAVVHREGDSIHLDTTDVQAVSGGGVTIEASSDGVTLTYRPPSD